jgi:hypothetical protein
MFIKFSTVFCNVYKVLNCVLSCLKFWTVLYCLNFVLWIRSQTLWQWYINTFIVFLDMIHCPVFIQKHITFRRRNSIFRWNLRVLVSGDRDYLHRLGLSWLLPEGDGIKCPKHCFSYKKRQISSLCSYLNTTAIKISLTSHCVTMSLLVLQYDIALHVSTPKAIIRRYTLTKKKKQDDGWCQKTR